MTTTLGKGDFVIFERYEITPGFYQIHCTKLFLSKEAAKGAIEDIVKALNYYATGKT